MGKEESQSGTKGPRMEAEGPRMEAEGPRIEAEGSCMEAEGPRMEAEGSTVGQGGGAGLRGKVDANNQYAPMRPPFPPHRQCPTR